MEETMNNEVFFVNDSWCFMKREVNIRNFTISYSREGGFLKKELADAAKKAADVKYQEDLLLIKKIANIRYTFKEYLEYWLHSIFIKNTETFTKTIGVWAVRQLILPRIEPDILLNYITVDYIDDIIKRCIPVCESAGETALKYMRKFLKDAYAFGMIHEEIWKDLADVPHHIHKIRLLTKEELARFVKESSKHEGNHLEILLALFAGMRTGEIIGLKYEDFDESTRTVRIVRQCTTNYHLAESDGHFEYSSFREEKAPKGQSSRILRIPGFLFDELEKRKELNSRILQNMKKKGRKDLDTEHVAISSYGVQKSRNTLYCAVRRICRFANVPEISTHTLRHQFATMLLEKGMPLEEISYLLGHKSVMTTFNFYCGVMDADQEARDAVDALLPCPPDKGVAV